MSENAIKEPRGFKLKLSANGVQNLVMLGILILVWIAGTVLFPAIFLTWENVRNILVASTSVIITASAVTIVLISGNLDLSVAGVGAMSGVLFGLFTIAGIPVWLAAILALLCGATSGFLNGFIISKLKQPSFIISLVFKFFTSGIALIASNGQSIASGMPGNVKDIARTVFIGNFDLPLPILYAAVIAGIFLFIQNKTVFASQVYAIGANIKTARFSGINTVKIITTSFVLSGILAAFAGIIIVSRFSVADCSMLPGLETDCIIAAVLGGTDINGGRGTVLGMIVGALILFTITQIMAMLNVAMYDQQIVKGLVLILAILVNDTIRRKIKV
jgi:ribose/xylose/arabinose/galactoside ABC-type transport system permease subunit